jgi:hypothetical protein
MPDVLRPFRRADQWVKSLSRLKYTLATSIMVLLVMVLIDAVLIGDVVEVVDGHSAAIIFGYAVSIYVLYPWAVEDDGWSFPTSWPNGRE